jgi:hypothetical protein
MTTQKITTHTSGFDFSRLRLLLDEHEVLFTRLDALSKRQGSLVEAESTDDLLKVLTERQTVIETIESVARELQPFRDQWDSVLARANTEQRDRFSVQIDRLSDLAAQVAARDDADRQLMERRRDALAGELAGTGKARGAVAAYGSPPPQRVAKFQDREA